MSDGHVLIHVSSSSQCGLAEDSREEQKTPAEVPKFGSKRTFITDIACSAYATFAITGVRELYSWGHGRFGVLGHGDEHDQLRPKMLEFTETPAMRIKQLSVGDHHVMCLTTSMMPYGWGENTLE